MTKARAAREFFILAVTCLALYHAGRSIYGSIDRQIFLHKQAIALKSGQAQSQEINKELREGLSSYRSSTGIGNVSIWQDRTKSSFVWVNSQHYQRDCAIDFAPVKSCQTRLKIYALALYSLPGIEILCAFFFESGTLWYEPGINLGSGVSAGCGSHCDYGSGCAPGSRKVCFGAGPEEPTASKSQKYYATH
jgi:hypothetical protein